jgi:hypothetical protein
VLPPLGLSEQATLKAEESYRYDYWFTPEAIYRIPIISHALTFVPFIGAYLLLGAAALFLPLSVWIVLFFAAFALAYLALRRMASDKRRAISALPSREILDHQKKVDKIPWEEIKTITLTKKSNVRISVGIHTYRGSIKPRDYESSKAFLSSKMGDRLQIREGMF